MRINQVFMGITYSVWRPFKIRYKLRNYSDPNSPAIFYGLYTKNHHNFIMQHKSLGIVVWAGSDSMKIPPYLANWFRDNEDRIFHLAYSHWIKSDLEFHGIKYIEKPIFGMDFTHFRFSGIKGDKIYNYHARKDASAFYGYDFCMNIAKKYPAVKFELTILGQYRREELQKVYDQCYLGVRMTTHDQMALSVIEMGLLGKYSIFNGNVPCALNYKDEKEAEEILLEYWANPPEPDRLLAEQMREFTYDDEKWLNTEFYGF